jgi:NAD(P)-dependent dehydrogenase (short-subunit alcohol dehydrogenase family)
MGFEIARELIARGCRVVGTDKNPAGAKLFSEEFEYVAPGRAASGLIRASSNTATFVEGDVTDWSSIQKVFSVAVEKFGTVGRSRATSPAGLRLAQTLSLRTLAWPWRAFPCPWTAICRRGRRSPRRPSM